MLSAFVHFSPKNEPSILKSGNWLIKDIIIENVDHVYNYNFDGGLWQTGQPVTEIRFDNVKATGILSAFNIIGDDSLNFNLQVKNSRFSFRKGADYDEVSFEGGPITSSALFNATNFDKIKLQDVLFEKKSTKPVLNSMVGNSFTLDQVTFTTGSNNLPYKFDKISDLKK